MENNIISRYATERDIKTKEYEGIINKLNSICKEYKLTDHSRLNKERYPWSEKYLTSPQMYATRLWEYPFAILNADLKRGMKCADVGCGESAFTIYLETECKCKTIGFDKDIYLKGNKDNFGVSTNIFNRTGIQIVQCSIENIPWEDNYFDRVFCISVVEHITDFNTRAKGMREISRILKPRGLAVITVDVNLMMRLANPLELVWESGLNIMGKIDLTMPKKRFGIYCDGKQPADVFGLILQKDDSPIDVSYKEQSEVVEAWKAAYLRETISDNRFESAICYDLHRNLKNKKPSYLTLSRIALKILLKKYPGLVKLN
jgi:SAM-dependent methyltransferase